MNVRKPIDYSAIFTSLDTLMAADLPQMELYYEIGRLVSTRPEKDDAVVEYALRRTMSPTLVSDYTLHLPSKKALQAKLHELTEVVLDTEHEDAE